MQQSSYKVVDLILIPEELRFPHSPVMSPLSSCSSSTLTANASIGYSPTASK